MTMPIVRRYAPADYPEVARLYKYGLHGGQFDEARDAEIRLSAICERDPDAILVAEINDHIVGTISLIEDGRVAWLFRFAVEKRENTAALENALHERAVTILRERGHQQVLVYTPVDNMDLVARYETLGLTKGTTYMCFWQNLNEC